MSYPNYRYYILERIKKKYTIRDSGCIEYAETKHKYGLISITMDMKRKSVPAHRAMYMATNDCLDLPSNIHIRHKCDNPKCINIKHLEPGTPKDNTQDCIKRGRRATKYKLHTRHYILDDDTVRAIRAATGKQKWIAQEFGVSVGYVSKLRSGKAKTLL